ncbi:STAS domain-containing protein [Leptospira interrogans]|uniref:Antagonist of anti-sigma factor n=9 Tax=Leptospira interrogans TaxID=173 RepID=Q8EXZ5_LEPIN|nr:MULTISPECIES: STAS domain-containing protein [Leptospira]APH43278.1 STAS domain protein [Leptospira interrogans serovar Copenhageni/Icterohaemorrhagiae]KAA1264168.1 anti-sigma factor antagonist [Leptospira interrogans serovar Weerasinghe]KAA1293557.1 anti-sigma factor antagonist [Leptospira interrogans serovar Geyaweera]AAN51621.1 antagonist of anti-sigma factor [Leptospira interrogans serovar Lai str. 56601]AAS72077.1 anti-sigma factor antagonist [Leptospira interrogans serovar Copenhageni
MSQLKIKKKEISTEIFIYVLDGRLDESSFTEFKTEIIDPPHPNVVILNLNELKYVSSSGIRSIFELKHKLSNDGKKLFLTEASEKVIQIFNLLGLWKPFTHFDTETQALEAATK